MNTISPVVFPPAYSPPIGSGTSDKRYRLCQLDLQERMPLVMMLEGAGHRVTDSAAGRRPGVGRPVYTAR